MREVWTPPPGSIPTLPIPTLDGVRRIHLVGIGGAGMRNLARLLHARGLDVQGSDLKASASLEELRGLGVRVWIGHDAAHLDEGGRPDVVVISSAIRAGNPELDGAAARSIAIWRRQQALAALTSDRRAVAVAGTHGKTTTTSMVAAVLTDAGLDPSYLIGGDLNETGGGARHGAGHLFVYEADESDGSFLLGAPWTGILTNIEVDHVDFYGDALTSFEDAFVLFAERCAGVVACVDDAAVRRVLERSGVEAVTYGTTRGDLTLEVRALGPEGARGIVRADDASVDLALRVDGVHNLLNATAALGVARRSGVDLSDAAASLASFAGVHRRFELRGEARGARFFDDYGHTPTEMAVTIETARRLEPRRLIALVQPHRYTRVQALWRELGASVAAADLVVVTDVDGAAQPPIPGVTGRLVADGVTAAAPATPTVYLPHRRDVVDYLAGEVAPGDLVITMGCGDVWMLGDAIRERIEAATG
jgi:UDP-N-acetylmuramate--alanine ligase